MRVHGWHRAGFVALFALAMPGASPVVAGGASGDGSPLTIGSPKRLALVSGGTLRFTARAGSHVGGLRVTVDGRPAKARITREGVRIHGAVPLQGVTRGYHWLTLHGRHDVAGPVGDAWRLIRGRPAPGLLSVSAPHTTEGVPRISVRARARPYVLRVRVNGQIVPGKFLDRSGNPTGETLSPREGLKPGQNRVKVAAWHRDGRFDVERRVIRVRRGVALPDAGRDVEVRPGQPVRLSAARTYAPPGIGKLRYRWRVVDEPAGARARLRGGAGPRPVLVPDPDVHGVYRVALGVGRGRSSPRSAPRLAQVATGPADTVEIGATATPPIGWQIDTLAADANGGSGIRIGEQFYPSPDPPDVQWLAFDRATLELNQQGTGIDDLIDLEPCSTSDQLVVVAAPSVAAPDLANAVSNLASVTDTFNCVPPPPAEGVSDAGASLILDTNGYANWRGDLTGYLDRSTVTSQGQNATQTSFRFVAGDYRAFDTFAPGAPENGNVITVGELTDSQELGVGEAGFHVLAVDAQTLEKVDGRAFATELDGGPGPDIGSMISWLSSYGTDPRLAVIVQSIGSPEPQTGWTSLAGAIERAGGNPYVFTMMGPPFPPGYTLYGGGAIAEPLEGSAAVTDADDSAPQLRPGLSGMLGRDRSFALAPQLIDRLGNLDLSLMRVAYQEPVDWPCSTSTPPAPCDAAHEAAGAYIATDSGRLDSRAGSTLAAIRESFWSNAELDPAQMTSLMDCDRPPQTSDLNGFTSTDFTDVCDELKEEWSDVDQVRRLLGSPDATDGLLQQAILGGELPVYNYLQTTVIPEVQETANPPTSGPAWIGDLGDVLSDLTWLSTELDDVDGVNPVGVLSAAFAVTGDSYSTTGDLPGGTGSDAPVADVASKLPGDLLDRIQNTVTGFSDVGQIIVSDRAKLRYVASQTDSGGPWSWGPLVSASSTSPAALQDVFADSLKRWSYRTLVPARYEIFELENPPADQKCKAPAGEYGPLSVYPFRSAPDGSYFGFFADWDAATSRYWIALTRNGRDVMADDLAEAISEGNTQLYRPWFFADDFDGVHPISGATVSDGAYAGASC